MTDIKISEGWFLRVTRYTGNIQLTEDITMFRTDVGKVKVLCNGRERSLRISTREQLRDFLMAFDIDISSLMD